jgi:energy-coupling factor transporter ATP-binding protein EcfA2
VEPLIQINDLHYKPVGSSADILKAVSLEINEGDFVLLVGPSGCGKSILSRCINGLIPNLDGGEMSGEVRVMGMSTCENPIHKFASIIGIVFQNPDDQILSLRVVDEVAWGVENSGIPHEEIRQRVDEYMQKCDISHLWDRLTFAISGGQKQKVSIASNLAMCQKALILDDPTTDLDPVCKSEVVGLLTKLYNEEQKTLIIIEHDFNDLIEMANRIVVMDAGVVVFDGQPGQIIAQHYDELVKLGMNIPQHVEIAHSILVHKPQVERYPTGKEEAFQIFKEFIQQHTPLPERAGSNLKPAGEPIVRVRDLKFAYDPSRPVLKGVSFDINQGEFVAIVGANGSGKSTLVNNLVGLLTPDSGQVIIDGQDTSKVKVSKLAQNIGYVFQNPDQQLFTNSVAEEAGFSLKVHNVPVDEKNRRVADVLQTVGLSEYANRHPFSLSRGQRQKLAVATALIHDPRIMLLDEPTTGQDRQSLSGLLDLMVQLNQQGNTTIMVTHDMDIVAAYASRVIVMADGQIVMDGRPEDVFYDQFETLSQLRLRPPTLVDYCRRLERCGMPRFLTIEELKDYINAIYALMHEPARVANL